MATLAPTFLNGYSSYLQVTRTSIKSWLSSKFGQIPPLTTELAALERPKFRCLHFFAVAMDLILFKLEGKKYMYTILD